MPTLLMLASSSTLLFIFTFWIVILEANIQNVTLCSQLPILLPNSCSCLRVTCCYIIQRSIQLSIIYLTQTYIQFWQFHVHMCEWALIQAQLYIIQLLSCKLPCLPKSLGQYLFSLEHHIFIEVLPRSNTFYGLAYYVCCGNQLL